MISNLATLALAFMASTASAQSVTLYQADNCLTSSVVNRIPLEFRKKAYVLGDLLGSNCNVPCIKVDYVVGQFMNIGSVKIDDNSKCYFWTGPDCGIPGSYQAAAAGQCTGTPGLAVPQLVNIQQSRWSFQCYSGSCFSLGGFFFGFFFGIDYWS